MKLFTKIAFVLFLVYFSIGLFINYYSIKIRDSHLSSPHPYPYYDYSGVMNVHTTKSTGTGDFEEVVRDAQKSKLDFIIFTDFNQFPQSQEEKGYYDKLLVMAGGEYSYLNSYLLNIGVESQDHLKGPGQSQPIFKDLLSKKNHFRKEGLFILTHPLKRGFEWKRDYPNGLDGIEVINLKSVWKNTWETKKISFLWTLLMYPFNPEFSFARLLSYQKDHLELWDSLNSKRSVFGFAGTDAEARFNFINAALEFPSYEILFRIVKNHVLLGSELTGQEQKDTKKIVNAFRKGNFYFSIDFLGNPKGFLALIKNKGKKFLPGSKVKLSLDTKIVVSLPKYIKTNFKITLYKNGKKYLNLFKENASVKLVDPGVYRIVVWVELNHYFLGVSQWVPWIFTNPFYIDG